MIPTYVKDWASNMVQWVPPGSLQGFTRLHSGFTQTTSPARTPPHRFLLRGSTTGHFVQCSAVFFSSVVLEVVAFVFLTLFKKVWTRETLLCGIRDERERTSSLHGIYSDTTAYRSPAAAFIHSVCYQLPATRRIVATSLHTHPLLYLRLSLFALFKTLYCLASVLRHHAPNGKKGCSSTSDKEHPREGYIYYMIIPITKNLT